jgi:hypothetical protein
MGQDRKDRQGAHVNDFDQEVAEHDRRERRLLWKEVAAIVFVAVVITIRQLTER